MGRMRLLDKVFNASASQVEGFCIVKSVGIKTNVKGAAYLDMVLRSPKAAKSSVACGRGRRMQRQALGLRAGGTRLIRSEHGHKGARHDKHVERRGAA